MKKFKNIYIMSVVAISFVVMIFFYGDQCLVYAAAGLLWLGFLLQIATKEKMPERVIDIRGGRTMKIVFGVMGLSNVFLMFRGVSQIIEYGAVKDLYIGSFIATPLMFMSFFADSGLYIYEDGIVSCESVFEFSKIESVKWENKNDSAKLIFVYEKKEFVLNIPSKKVEMLDEVLKKEGLLVDDGV